MRPEPKKKIDTSASQAPLAGLGIAFAGMDLPGLPPGEPARAPAKPPERLWKMGRVVLRKEKAHRGGKTVIVVDDFATHLPVSVIEAAAKKLRAGCGCGGTVKERRIEVQGDQPAKVRAILEGEGFEVAGVR
jgi:translation initiation factor 1